ncbi:MAG: DNA polymerase III subunit alpha, partial [Verrucomicrobia bacterium]|nr:DNA polymerase III subunit alpha [Verrucomicrobiota bacterium]
SGDEEGPIRQHLENGDLQSAHETLTKLQNIFGKGNLYVEIQRHHARGEDWTNRRLLELAEAENLPVIATNGATFTVPHERPLYDAFTCLRHHTLLDTAGSLLSRNTQRYLKSPAQMAALFADLPEAIENTARLAERLEFDLQDLGYQFPKYPVPSEAQHLREKTYAGARERYGNQLSKKVRDQLDHELRIITKLGFCGYFLIVWDIVNFAREQGILVQGRGSAANSAVCYSLGITACDPIGYELLFERFLSEGRESWPDIDLDLPSGERRESVIQEVYRRFAPRGAAMTANVITYRGKSAIREMGKVLGFPETILGRFSDLYGGHGGGSGDSKEELTERLKKSGLAADHPRLPALLHLYNSVRGLPRHLGQHSGGMIICDTGLDAVVPLQPASMPNRTIVQWDKDDCEDLGIVKVDLLGLGMLAAMEDTLHICQQRGHPVDLALIPKDDPATFDLLCRADTIGTFQVESRAQMATLPVMRPKTFYDLAIEVAIIRPGPIVGDLVHPYLNRRNGREPVDHIHPAFEPVLARTLGVPLFQEQVLRMAMIIAGFDGAEADELRRAMAFKRADERMESIALKLRSRMSERNIDLLVQDKVVKAIGSFALYGFPESHAISFALIAYASCWLKAHHPAEFYAGLLNNQPMGFYSVSTLLEDAKRHGIKTKPVSILHSQADTSVLDNHTLRLGLHRLKGLRTDTIHRLLEARSHQQFSSLPDFLNRVTPNKTERRLLAASGALNGLPESPHRRAALWNAEKDHHDDLFGDQLSVISYQSPEPTLRVADAPTGSADFQTGPNAPVCRQITNNQSPITPLLPMTAMERLQTDYTTLGHSTGQHPMALWRAGLQPASKTPPSAPADANPLPSDNQQLITAPYRASELHSLHHGDQITIRGMVICRQRPGTAKGHCFISLEDETGIANLFVPRDTFQRYRLTITTERFLLCHGRLQISEGGQPTLYTTAIHPLPFPTQLHTRSHDFH